MIDCWVGKMRVAINEKMSTQMDGSTDEWVESSIKFMRWMDWWMNQSSNLRRFLLNWKNQYKIILWNSLKIQTLQSSAQHNITKNSCLGFICMFPREISLECKSCSHKQRINYTNHHLSCPDTSDSYKSWKFTDASSWLLAFEQSLIYCLENIDFFQKVWLFRKKYRLMAP